MTIRPVSSRHVDALHTLLKAHGAQTALAWLNAGVPHRYSAIYCLKGDSFTPLFVHDKLGERTPPLIQVVPFEFSFCKYVMQDGEFATHDTTADARLDGNPYQGVVMSYQGVAIVNAAGEFQASLCHFDIVCQSLADSEHTLMQAAAKLFFRYLTPLRKRRARPVPLNRDAAVPPIESPDRDRPAAADATVHVHEPIDCEAAALP